MSKQIILRQSAIDRRKLLIDTQNSSSGRRAGFGEVAGNTTAECAAVCCCCPCGIVDLVVLTVYRFPAGLCRKVLRRRRRRRLLKEGLLPEKGESRRIRCGCDDSEIQIHPVTGGDKFVMMSLESDQDVIELEKEMWEQFYGTGFWRSLSQRV